MKSIIKEENPFLYKPSFITIFIILFAIGFLISISYAYPCGNSQIVVDGIVKKHSVNGVVFYYVKPGSSINATPIFCNVRIRTCGNTAGKWVIRENYYSLTTCLSTNFNIIEVEKTKVSQELTKDKFEKIIIDEINVENNINISNFPIEFKVKDFIVLSNRSYFWNDIYSDPETLCYKYGNYSDIIAAPNCENIGDSLKIACGYAGVVEIFMYESVYDYFQNKLNNSYTCYTEEEKISDNVTKITTICNKYILEDIISSSSAKIEYIFLNIKEITTTIKSEEKEETTVDGKMERFKIEINFENIYQNITSTYFTTETKTFTCAKVVGGCVAETRKAIDKYYIPSKIDREMLNIYVFSSYPVVVIVEKEKNIFEKTVDFIKSTFNFININRDLK